MEFSESDEFKNEFRKLAKKYPTLSDDLDVVKSIIAVTPKGNGTKHWNTLKQDEHDNRIIKMRMMCRSVKGSQFRLVYFYNDKNVEVLFIELYFKGNKEREDVERIKDFFAKQSPL
jgi:mRNA-degrading endonuclease RelE of RelBE toxin-antitoxin system